jgi:flagellar hook-associated protein 2
VTASANGAVNGSYEVKVTQVATKGQLMPSDTTLSVASLTDPIFSGSETHSFAVKGTDGTITSLQVTNNTLGGLRDAINSSGAAVTATVINTGGTTNPYRLVLTAKETGKSSTGDGKVWLAATDGKTNLLNIGAAAAPDDLTGGLSSDTAAVNAIFSVNGIELTRTTNVVSDAVDGVSFTLKKGDLTNTTTLTVVQDKSAAVTAMQDVLNKFNTLVKNFKSASTSTKDSSTGEVIAAPLSNDSTARSILDQLRAAMGGVPSGLSETAAYKRLSDIGIKTTSDGTLSLDTTVFQAAMDKNPATVQALSQGVGQSVQTLVSNLTSYSGNLQNTVSAIDLQNKTLTTRIESGQTLLDKRKLALQAQFQKMESTISQLRAASGSLSGIG